MNEFLDQTAMYWDVFYNEWLGFLPWHHRPALLVLVASLIVIGSVVFYYKSRLRKALKGHIHLNRKIDELQRDVYRANDRAANKPDPHVAEMRQMFTTLLAAMEKSNASSVSSVASQARASSDAIQFVCKDLSGKIDATLAKAMERIEKSQESSNRILTETIKQMVDLSKSQHAAAMKTVSEAIAINDDDDDDDDDEE